MSEHGHGSAECREMFARLSEYVDGNLDPALCDRIGAHMEECAPCVAFLESLRNTVKLLRQVDRPSLPAEVRSGVLEAYRRFRSGETP